MLSLAACGGRSAETAPRNVATVGAAEHFGPGIVTVGDLGDRILVDVRVPSYWSLVRLDTSGAPIGANAMDTRHMPAMTWIAVPSSGQGQSRATRSVVNPICDRTDRNARQRCSRSPRVFETGPVLLRTGEALILFVTADPMNAAALEDRLNDIGPGTPLLHLPAIIMEGRVDAWAAYLVRR